MGRKLSKEEFEKRISEIHGDKLDVSEFNFTITSAKGKCKCNVCGNEWYVVANSLLLGHGCRKCYDKCNSEKRLIGKKDIEKRIRERGYDITFSDDYIDTKHKCHVRCNNCGKEWVTKPSTFFKNYSCDGCNRKERNAKFIEEIKTKFGTEKYTYEKLKYDGFDKDAIITCKKHGDFLYNTTLLKKRCGQQEICPMCLLEKRELKKRHKEIKKEEYKRKLKELEEIRENRKIIKKIQKENNIKEAREQKQKDFIEKSKQLYKDYNYDYSKVDFVSVDTKVTIICPTHGEFEARPYTFLQGHKCPKCSEYRSSAYTTEEWIAIAKEKHPMFKYDKVKYKDKTTKIVVECPTHGGIEVYPNIFLRQAEPCSKCRMEKQANERSRKNWEQIETVYKDKNYTITNRDKIITQNEKIEVRCNKHNFMFYPKVSNVIKHKCGCPKCGVEENASKSRLTVDEIKERAHQIYDGKYDLSLLKTYKNFETKIPILCPIHGRFIKSVHQFLGGQGCQICANETKLSKLRLTQEEFIEKAKEKHFGKDFDFSETIYKTYNDFVTVFCNKKDKSGKPHGYFTIKAGALLNGNGCPICKSSRLEQKVRADLIKNGIQFIPQMNDFNWLRPQSFDFYLLEYNIAIECQGIQHFEAVFPRNKDIEYREKLLEINQERDIRKKQLCRENGVGLIYYLNEHFAKYMQDDDVYFTNTNDLISYIQNLPKIS